MSVIKEWCCVEHGNFEGSHPICPQNGCDSGEVTQVFLTPFSISKGKYRRFENGMRRTSEMMGISDFSASREGDTAFDGRASQESKELGMEVLWGQQSVEKKMGRSFAGLMQEAEKPLQVNGKTLNRNNAMRDLANESGITGRALPRAAEVAHHRTEKAFETQAKGLVA